MRDTRRPTLRLKELSEPKQKPWSHHDFFRGYIGKRVVIKINVGMAPQMAAVTLVAFDQWTIMVRDDHGNEGVFFKTHILSLVPYNPAHHDPLFKAAAEGQGA